MNTLSKEEALLFHKLMDSLLLFVNQKTGMIKNTNSMKELHQSGIEKTMQLRKKIFSDKFGFIDSFIQENPFNFSEEELDIIRSWKKYKTDAFFITKHAKEYSLFFSSENQKIYGVKGITDSFEEKFQGYTPVAVQITLIPFKEHIIYDGILAPYNLSFGGTMQKTLKADTEKTIREFGIITSLDRPIKRVESTDEEMLRFYMKSFDNKMRYEKEAQKLRKKSSKLEAVYYQEEARDFARSFKKSLKELCVKGHFAVLNNVIVASATNEKELDENITKLLPKDKMDWIYRFKI